MEKKTKLTISGTAKKSIKNIEKAKTQGKNSVLIEKQIKKFSNKSGSFRPTSNKPKSNLPFNRGPSLKPNFTPKTPTISSDFERRKLAEQRATKRLKEENESKNKKTIKSGTKKRELKLTVSRALSDQIEARERSLASVKRARQKENKSLTKEESQDNLKPIKRDVNIPEAITVRELANRMAEQSSNVIKYLFGMGVTVTPIPNKYLITLLDCSAILLANSLTVIASGILISLLIGLRFSWASPFIKFLFSFCLALLTEAKLLSLASISSLRALETVSFNSLFLVPDFKVFLSFPSLSPLSLFVALCSASLRLSKSFVIGGDFGTKADFILVPLLNEELGFVLPGFGLKDPTLFGNFPVCFSITTAFLL